ncbi:hypothetical protein [Marinilactibacillus sp. Marseille-P9653]|uniref:hypothetical protein n=1 Tax=Marinilactibacillus sp. Marseille-P9653 TaxID=2866583 RepID=UPI001CE3C53B|nr:hypothetical protein [Marinilactibacillus sp. Marseille-P9653]
MAKIYRSKLNMSEISEKIRKDPGYLNKILTKMLNELESGQSVDSEEDENVYYRLHYIEKNFALRTVSGRLFKVEKSKEVNLLDGEEVESQILKNMFSQVAFSFQVDQEIVAFVPKRDLSRDEFHKYFGKILTKMQPEIKEVNFQLLFDKRAFNKRLSKIDKATRATFTLVKPNGKADEEVEEFADMLTDTGAAKSKISLEADKKSPLKKSSETFKALLKYVSNGWGSANIVGYSEEKGKTVTIDTKKDVLDTDPISESNKDSHKYIENKIFGRNE